MRQNNIRVLNVAGNIEPKSRTALSHGITAFVIDYLSQVFCQLGHRDVTAGMRVTSEQGEVRTDNASRGFFRQCIALFLSPRAAEEASEARNRRPATTPTRPPTTSRRGCPLNEATRCLLRLADDISPLQEDPVIVGDKAKGHDGPCLAIMGTNCSVAIAYESSAATYYLGISAHGPANLDGNVARRLVRLRDAIERAME